MEISFPHLPLKQRGDFQTFNQDQKLISPLLKQAVIWAGSDQGFQLRNFITSECAYKWSEIEVSVR